MEGNGIKEGDVALRLEVPPSPVIRKKESNNDDGEHGKRKYTHDDRLYEKETKLLRHRLKVYFYSAVKYKDHICSFQAIYFILMLLQVLKVVLITAQMFNFGDDRVDFNNVVHRGHITLRHLLLEDWDASWETVPYPPAQGEFAVYDIENLKKKINFAVTNLFNAPADAIGFFVLLDSENVTADMTYFDFEGFNGASTESDLQIKQTSFTLMVDEIQDDVTIDNATSSANTTTVSPDNMTVTVDNTTSASGASTIGSSSKPKAARASVADRHFKYDVDKDFERHKLSDPIKRLLTITIKFQIYSVRVDIATEKARCLRVKGWVHFKDPDNNGQVIQDLETLTSRIKCADLNYRVQDRELETANLGLSITVILMVLCSMAYTVSFLVYGVFVMLRTKRYMKKYFKKYYEPEDPREKDLPAREYARFFKGWDLIVLTADITTIIGTFGMILVLKRFDSSQRLSITPEYLRFALGRVIGRLPTADQPGTNKTMDASWTIGTLEEYAVVLGIGCILAWVGLLRYLKFNYKFHLLFNTMYTSIWDVMAYLACITLLFVGYMSFGYVVIGPYHIKFRTPSDAATTLFALINGDEIYATFALLEESWTGGTLIPTIYRIYIGSYVAIFTIIVINLLIALFTNAYDAAKLYLETLSSPSISSSPGGQERKE